MTKDKIKGIFTRPPCCHRDLIHHNNDCILFSNNNVGVSLGTVTLLVSIVVPILLIRTLLESLETGLSHLNKNIIILYYVVHKLLVFSCTPLCERLSNLGYSFFYQVLKAFFPSFILSDFKSTYLLPTQNPWHL